MQGNPVVETWLERLERKDPLDLDRVSEVVDRIKRPDLVKQKLEKPFAFAQKVELDAAGLGINILVPRAQDELHPIQRFLRIWTPDEQGHSVALGMIMDHCGIERIVGRSEDYVPPHNVVIGALARAFETVEQINEFLYNVSGAMNEYLARYAYMASRQIALGIGEEEVADEVLKKLIRDESFHGNYYYAYADELAPTMHPWQRRLCRVTLPLIWAPVGAGDDRDKPLLGDVVRIFEQEDPESPHVADKVQEIAQELLGGHDSKPVPLFVPKAIGKCVRLAIEAESDTQLKTAA